MSKLDNAVASIEKWSLIVLVLLAYLFMSYKIINSCIRRPAFAECGNVFMSNVPAHTVLAIIVAIILALKFYFHAGYSIKEKLIIYSIIAAPLIVTIVLD